MHKGEPGRWQPLQKVSLLFFSELMVLKWGPRDYVETRVWPALGDPRFLKQLVSLVLQESCVCMAFLTINELTRNISDGITESKECGSVQGTSSASVRPWAPSPALKNQGM